MTVAQFVQPDVTLMTAAEYKQAIDASVYVMKQLAAGFAASCSGEDLLLKISPGARFDRATGAYYTFDTQTVTLTAAASTSKYARVYILDTGSLAVIYGSESASPSKPQYPGASYPVCAVLIDTSGIITNANIIDERAFFSGYGTQSNSFLVTTSNTSWTCPIGAKLLRVTFAGGGGGGGGCGTNAGGTSAYPGGGGGGAASMQVRTIYAENLNITIGAGGNGGTSSVSFGTAGSAGSAGGTTTITGLTSGNTMTAPGGGGGGGGTTAAVGAAGTAGAAGTPGGTIGIAGTVGVTGTITGGVPAAALKGGNGGGVGASSTMSPVVIGRYGTDVATLGSAGPAGVRGSGGGGACITASAQGGSGGKGGDGFVLIEVF